MPSLSYQVLLDYMSVCGEPRMVLHNPYSPSITMLPSIGQLQMLWQQFVK